MDINPSTVNLEKFRQQAHDAYRNLSFDPEKRAQAIVQDFGQELREDLLEIQKAMSHVPAVEVDIQLGEYRNKYERHLEGWLRTKSNTASPMITGPANFPTQRMKKAHAAADNKYEQFREWRGRTLAAIVKSVTAKVSELEQARQRLKEREDVQQFMTAANKIVRQGGADIFDNLRALGMSEGLVMQIFQTGFRPYQLHNNGAEIRRLRTRVAKLEAKENLALTKGQQTEIIDGVKLVENYEADRVQLIFDGKPEQEMINALKSRGFRWTPSQKAWQRKLTNQAIYDAKAVIGKGKSM